MWWLRIIAASPHVATDGLIEGHVHVDVGTPQSLKTLFLELQSMIMYSRHDPLSNHHTILQKRLSPPFSSSISYRLQYLVFLTSLDLNSAIQY